MLLCLLRRAYLELPSSYTIKLNKYSSFEVTDKIR